MNAINAAKEIVADARRAIPGRFLQVSGRALYSPASTLSGDSPCYFLGVNPSEAPASIELHSVITVEEDLKRLEEDQITEHGYLDERWKSHPPGQAPIQLRAQWLFSLLVGGSISDGMSLLRATPTSNFILQRSVDVEALKKNTGLSDVELARRYWPFHEAVIRQTSCSVVLTHAIGIARQLARDLGLGEGQARPSGWGGTLATCYAWHLPSGQVLLSVPNLSRYRPDGPRIPALADFFREFVPASLSQWAQQIAARDVRNARA